MSLKIRRWNIQNTSEQSGFNVCKNHGKWHCTFNDGISRTQSEQSDFNGSHSQADTVQNDITLICLQHKTVTGVYKQNSCWHINMKYLNLEAQKAMTASFKGRVQPRNRLAAHRVR
jgi:hypothetical protein